MMKARIEIHPLCIEDRDCYDLLVCALGFESRSSYVPLRFGAKAKRKVAIGFDQNHVLSYEENKISLEQVGYEIIHCSDENFGSTLNNLIIETQNNIPKSSILIDISSLNRCRLASTVCGLRQLKNGSVDFVYSIAQYTPPPDQYATNVHIGPVMPEFAGWTDSPEQPVTAIVGLGYEQDRALGAIEHVQASSVVVLFPESPVKQYLNSLILANSGLIDLIDFEQWMPYNIMFPVDLYQMMESLVHSYSNKNSVIIFPFGPKIFTLASLLVALVYEDTAVWRISPGYSQEPLERYASDHLTGLSAVVVSGEIE